MRTGVRKALERVTDALKSAGIWLIKKILNL